jgi:hypothetical protein
VLPGHGLWSMSFRLLALECIVGWMEEAWSIDGMQAKRGHQNIS